MHDNYNYVIVHVYNIRVRFSTAAKCSFISFHHFVLDCIIPFIFGNLGTNDPCIASCTITALDQDVCITEDTLHSFTCCGWCSWKLPSHIQSLCLYFNNHVLWVCLSVRGAGNRYIMIIRRWQLSLTTAQIITAEYNYNRWTLGNNTEQVRTRVKPLDRRWVSGGEGVLSVSGRGEGRWGQWRGGWGQWEGK